MQRKKERQENSSGGTLPEMLAFVDEFGNITDTPPEEQDEKLKEKIETDF